MKGIRIYYYLFPSFNRTFWYKIFFLPNIVNTWVNSDWYQNAISKRSNNEIYGKYINQADSILYYDIPEEPVIVEFVNRDKKILNFIASNSKFGFFKYERFLEEINVGDTLNVRFNGNGNEGSFQVFTVAKATNEIFKKEFIKEVSGKTRITEGKNFGFIEDIYIHPSIVAKNKLSNNQSISVKAIQTFNLDKKQWSWKAFEILQ